MAEDDESAAHRPILACSPGLVSGPTPPFCQRYHKAVEVIGKRWTGAILLDVARFANLREVVPGLSDRMLAERLKELHEEGIVERVVHAETPVRTEYRLTKKGRELHDAVYALSRSADRWIPLEVPTAT